MDPMRPRFRRRDGPGGAHLGDCSSPGPECRYPGISKPMSINAFEDITSRYEPTAKCAEIDYLSYEAACSVVSANKTRFSLLALDMPRGVHIISVACRTQPFPTSPGTKLSS